MGKSFLWLWVKYVAQALFLLGGLAVVVGLIIAAASVAAANGFDTITIIGGVVAAAIVGIAGVAAWVDAR